MKTFILHAITCLLLWTTNSTAQEGQPYIQVLGIAQDGGYPHLGCTADCCNKAWANDSLRRFVVSLALVDPAAKKWWLFEATPDINNQLHYFQELSGKQYPYLPEGIFVTHAHIGHYTGLMHLGMEVFDTKDVNVYCLPKMRSFLESNGPWSQLVSKKNILLHTLTANEELKLNERISITAFEVPHRDEYSEAAGFRIATSSKKYLFIPDINKWSKWDKDIVKETAAVDVAFLDATFYRITELKSRKIEEVPHPLVVETLELFSKAPADTRARLVFIHFNHTNPLMTDQALRNKIGAKGFRLAVQGKIY